MTPSAKSLTLGQATPTVDITLAGDGQCKAFLMVTKDGKLISSTGATSFSFPSKKPVSLPKTGGRYKIELVGNSGCIGAKASTEVNVLYARPTNIATRGR